MGTGRRIDRGDSGKSNDYHFEKTPNNEVLRLDLSAHFSNSYALWPTELILRFFSLIQCIFIGFCTSVLVSVHSGFGAHLATLSPSSAQSALRASTVGEIFAVWTYPTGKAAVACLLMRVFPWQRLKWLLWSFVAVNAVFFYLNGVLLLVECRPVAFQWDKTITGGSCWNPEVLVIWGYITGSKLDEAPFSRMRAF